VPPPSPRMLINHITGNRKCLYQLMQACCKPDTGEITQQSPRTFIRSRKTIAFPVGVALCAALKASVAPQTAQVHAGLERGHGAPRVAAVARAVQPDLSTAIKRAPNPRLKRGLLALEPQAASRRHIMEDMLATR
jgi:hypothetical protein